MIHKTIKKNVYDFIILGAGSAGCIIANRLAKHNVSVALIEAGPEDNTKLFDYPLGIFPIVYLEKFLKYNWNYKNQGTEPYVKDKVFYQPRGKGLGGTS